MSRLINELTRIKVLYQRLGVKQLAGIVATAVGKRIRGRVGFWRHRSKYPHNILFIAGMPKSGSTWLADMLSDLPGFEPFTPADWDLEHQVGAHGEHALSDQSFAPYRHVLAVIKGHTWGTPENVDVLRRMNLKHLVLVRDPRDVLISKYWFVRKTPHHMEYELAMESTLSEYITIKLKNGSFDHKTLDWARLWLKNRDPELSRIVRYRDQIRQPFELLKAQLDFLGFDVGDDVVRRIVKRHSFEKVTGRKRGMEDTGSVVRRATTGEWEKVFSKEQKREVFEQGEDVIEALGLPPTLEPQSRKYVFRPQASGFLYPANAS